jgi:hypothetical protein
LPEQKVTVINPNGTCTEVVLPEFVNLESQISKAAPLKFRKAIFGNVSVQLETVWSIFSMIEAGEQPSRTFSEKEGEKSRDSAKKSAVHFMTTKNGC